MKNFHLKQFPGIDQKIKTCCPSFPSPCVLTGNKPEVKALMRTKHKSSILRPMGDYYILSVFKTVYTTTTNPDFSLLKEDSHR